MLVVVVTVWVSEANAPVGVGVMVRLRLGVEVERVRVGDDARGRPVAAPVSWGREMMEAEMKARAKQERKTNASLAGVAK